MNKKHYVVMAGLNGCIPNVCQSANTIKECASIMASIHDLSESYVYRHLSQYRYMTLSPSEHGNEYIEVQECDCDEPETHNDY